MTNGQIKFITVEIRKIRASAQHFILGSWNLTCSQAGGPGTTDLLVFSILRVFMTQERKGHYLLCSFISWLSQLGRCVNLSSLSLKEVNSGMYFMGS